MKPYEFTRVLGMIPEHHHGSYVDHIKEQMSILRIRHQELKGKLGLSRTYYDSLMDESAFFNLEQALIIQSLQIMPAVALLHWQYNRKILKELEDIRRRTQCT